MSEYQQCLEATRGAYEPPTNSSRFIKVEGPLLADQSSPDEVNPNNKRGTRNFQGPDLPGYQRYTSSIDTVSGLEGGFSSRASSGPDGF